MVHSLAISGSDLLEVPTPTIHKAYFWGLNFREYPHKIWPYMVQYLHFRILEFPLIYTGFPSQQCLTTGGWTRWYPHYILVMVDVRFPIIHSYPAIDHYNVGPLVISCFINAINYRYNISHKNIVCLVIIQLSHLRDPTLYCIHDVSTPGRFVPLAERVVELEILERIRQGEVAWMCNDYFLLVDSPCSNAQQCSGYFPANPT